MYFIYGSITRMLTSWRGSVLLSASCTAGFAQLLIRTGVQLTLTRPHPFESNFLGTRGRGECNNYIGSFFLLYIIVWFNLPSTYLPFPFPHGHTDLISTPFPSFQRWEPLYHPWLNQHLTIWWTGSRSVSLRWPCWPGWSQLRASLEGEPVFRNIAHLFIDTPPPCFWRIISYVT